MDVKADHHTVVQLSAAFADGQREARDGLAVGTREAAHGALADALTEHSDNLNLLVARKDIHGTNPWRLGTGRPQLWNERANRAI